MLKNVLIFTAILTGVAAAQVVARFIVGGAL